ncbi:hypothetical protein Avbf_14107 [Armadillidium vulgare]|nr:hypothetical protein Avbf_14107 [Armadillidium vulgare]
MYLRVGRYLCFRVCNKSLPYYMKFKKKKQKKQNTYKIYDISSSIDYFEKYQLILFLCFKTENICSNKIIFFKNICNILSFILNKYSQTYSKIKMMMSDIEVDSSGSEWIPGSVHYTFSY